MLPHTLIPPVLPATGPWFDIAGLAVFAASGALAAAKRDQTFVTVVFFALITGVGGGTVRDLLIGAPVFWIRDARAASAPEAANTASPARSNHGAATGRISTGKGTGNIGAA